MSGVVQLLGDFSIPLLVNPCVLVGLLSWFDMGSTTLDGPATTTFGWGAYVQFGCSVLDQRGLARVLQHMGVL